jgi:acyl-CoA synthetase (AMP-forming)/AMP-acid ligase II/acyl carrier protein
MSFDAATFEIWGTLLNGGSLDIVPQEVVLNPKSFAAWLGERSVQSMFLTAALFNQIAMIEPAAFGTLRDLMVGGEALTPSWIRAVLEAGPPHRLLNGYGPTENTTFTTWYPIAEVEKEARSIPIGKPIANTRVYVLDRWLNPMPAGVPGELYIGGDGLAWGYLRRPELTAEKFIPDPFGEAGGRLYRSGDLVCWLRNGDIEFLGRIDTQVKLRGYRVELGEIEAVLQDHPAVRQAVVLLREDRPEDRRLVAYLVLHDKDPLENQALREFLGKRLPDYMVPQMFLFIQDIPITPNGKVDRRALPEPSLLKIKQDSSINSSMSYFERVMLQIWSDLLGFQVNRLEANFFELGGHSLLAIRLMYRIQELFELQLNPRLIFESPSAAGLIRAIQREAADADRLEKTAQVWVELEALSDEGATAILSQMKEGGEV